MKLPDFLAWMEDQADQSDAGDMAALMTARTLVRFHDLVVSGGVAGGVTVGEWSCEVAESWSDAWFYENISHDDIDAQVCDREGCECPLYMHEGGPCLGPIGRDCECPAFLKE